MEINEEELTAAEIELLKKLEQTSKLMDSLVNEQSSRQVGNISKDAELSALRDQVTKLNNENRSLKENIHIWKNNMDELLNKFK